MSILPANIDPENLQFQAPTHSSVMLFEGRGVYHGNTMENAIRYQ